MSPLCLDHPETFGRLYAMEAGGVLRYCGSRIRQREDADDVAGLVWLRAFEHRSAVKGMFRAWLYRIAHNAVVDYYRRQRSTVPLEAVAELSMDDWERVDAGLVCEAVLGRLDDRTRAILAGHWLAGMASREIGARLGMEAVSVRAVEARTLARLRKELAV